MAGTNDAKRELRRTMRAVRRVAGLEPSRSAAIVERLAAMPEVAEARVVMSFTAVAGEPDLDPLVHRLAGRAARVVAPPPDRQAEFPVGPGEADVVLVPGLAFTESGHRLGQGGGWYDRFLAGVRPDCLVVGVCFDEQVLDALPVDAHDVPVDRLVTPTRTIVAGGARHHP